MHGHVKRCARATRHLPQAAIAFDGFHVVQLANKAMDAVRKEESRRAGSNKPAGVGSKTKASGRIRSVRRWTGWRTPNSKQLKLGV